MWMFWRIHVATRAGVPGSCAVTAPFSMRTGMAFARVVSASGPSI
jgi:hypothetical protein